MSIMVQQTAIGDDRATEPPRKPTILDAMILVAVTAIGLDWNRSSQKDFLSYNSAFIGSLGPLLGIINST